MLSIHSDCPEPGNSHTIECNDDASAPYSPDSLVTFNYTIGTTYLIRVAGYNGHAGDYVLRINDYAPAPSNNTCSSPTIVPAAGGVYNWANCKATTDGPSTATTCGLHMINDVWFRFTAPTAGTLKMDTCGSNFDTMVQMFVSGVGCPSSIQEIGCNDDAPVGSPCPQQIRTSYLTHAVLAGQSYMIRVGGYDTNNPLGDGVLTVDFDSACPGDFNNSGTVSVQDIFDFLAAYFGGSSPPTSTAAARSACRTSSTSSPATSPAATNTRPNRVAIQTRPDDTQPRERPGVFLRMPVDQSGGPLLDHALGRVLRHAARMAARRDLRSICLRWT